MAESNLFSELDSYNWTADQEYQFGLQGILSSAGATSQEQIDELTLRARCFYFARKFNKQVDFEAYKIYTQLQSANSLQQPQAQSISQIPQEEEEEGEEGDVPRLSREELIEYIQSGKTVPGIKDIPDTILAGQGTQSIATRRRKPWEKDISSESTVDVSSESIEADQLAAA
jgi:hypothetical protein